MSALTVPRFARADEYGGAWAIEPSHGAALWSLARRTDLRAHVAAAVPPRLAAESGYEVARVGAGPAAKRVAIVPLVGTLMKQVSSMGGGTSTVAARRALRKAAADETVDAILLAVDSPGGTVSGTADLAAEVLAARRAKPVWAFVEDLGASAAYWVASQAERVYANTDTALVGSIGTLAVVYDLSAAAAREGVKALVFGTGPLKGAGVPGAAVSDEQQAYFAGLVADAQKSFDAAVRKGRGLTDRQLAEAKTGGVFGAGEALGRRLIDGVQSFDATLAQLVGGRPAPAARRAEAVAPAAPAATPPGPKPGYDPPPFPRGVFAPAAGPVPLDRSRPNVFLHEAAHAALARAVGLRVDRVLVSGPESGVVTVAGWREAPWRAAVAAAAGISVSRHTGSVLDLAHCEGDYRMIAEYGKLYRARHGFLWPVDPAAHAAELLATPAVAAAVNRIAAALTVGVELSGDAVERLIGGEEPPAVPAAGWPSAPAPDHRPARLRPFSFTLD